MAGHKRLAASKTKQFLNCPGSVRAEEKVLAEFPQLGEYEGPYAKEGTGAHAVLETSLAPATGEYAGGEPAITDPRTFEGGAVSPNGFVYAAKSLARPLDRMPDDYVPITADMVSAVSVAAEYVAERLEAMGPGTVLTTEKQYDMSWLDPDLGGTADVTLDQFLEELELVDYKHGKGVVVEVENDDGSPNEQVLTYLLAAANETGYSHERYRMTILQPRARHSDGPTRSIAVTRQQLLDFRDRLKKGAELTRDPNAPLKAGSWCRWCKAAGPCLEQKKLATQQAMIDFADPLPDEIPVPTTPEELAALLPYVPVFEAWLKSIEATAQRLAETGVTVPGHKLVHGKPGNRKISDPDALESALAAKGLDGSKIYEQKLRTPAAIEKLGKDYKKVIAAKGDDGEPLYTFRPEGKVKLVHESDPREPIQPTAITDFEAEEASGSDDE
jgi:hypothetical protein